MALSNTDIDTEFYQRAINGEFDNGALAVPKDMPKIFTARCITKRDGIIYPNVRLNKDVFGNMWNYFRLTPAMRERFPWRIDEQENEEKKVLKKYNSPHDRIAELDKYHYSELEELYFSKFLPKYPQGV